MHFMLPVCGGPQRRSEGGAKTQFSCGHLTWMTPMFQDTRASGNATAQPETLYGGLAIQNAMVLTICL